MGGVARAGNICQVNAKSMISSIPTHQTGKLELITAKLDVILSNIEPTLLPDSAPMSMPIIEIIMVAVVKRRTVFGSFSAIISPTLDEPESLVKNVACPKSSNSILYMDSPILCGEYQGSCKPNSVMRLSIVSCTYSSKASTDSKLSANPGVSAISCLTCTATPCFSITSMLEPTKATVSSNVTINTPKSVATLVATYFFKPTYCFVCN